MNTSTSWALTLALLLAGGAARAQGAALPLQDYPPQTRTSDRHESGVIVAVDAAAGKLKLRDSEGNIRRFSADKAKVDTPEGKTISLADLAVGDEVSVSYNLSFTGRDATEVLRLSKSMRR